MKTRRIMAFVLTLLMVFSCFVVTASATTSGVWTYEDAGRGDNSIIITGTTATGAVTVPATIDGLTVYGIGNDVGWNANISSLVISEGIQYIGSGAFGWMVSPGMLTSLTLPSTLTTMAAGAFVGCFYLDSVTIPAACVNFVADSGSEHGGYCALGSFFGIGYQTNTNGAAVTLYTDAAETYMSGISTSMVQNQYPAMRITKNDAPVVVDPDPVDPSDVTLFDYTLDANNNATITGLKISATDSTHNTNIGALEIPSSIVIDENGTTVNVKKVANGAFCNCGVTYLVIAEGVEELGDSAFLLNTAMTNITLPSTLTTMGDNAFALSYAVPTVVIPEACINFVDDTSYDCPVGGAKNNGLGIFYGLGASVITGVSAYCSTPQARAMLQFCNEQNVAYNNPEFTIVYTGTDVKNGGHRVGGMNPTFNFTNGWTSGAVASGDSALAVQSVAMTTSADYKTLTVVANVNDAEPIAEIKDGEPWISECFEVMLDIGNDYTETLFDAADRTSLIQLRISRAASGCLLTGRWLDQTMDTPTANSLFNGKFAGTLSRTGTVDTYTFTIDLTEFGIQKGDDIGFGMVAQSCWGANGNWGTSYLNNTRYDASAGTWDAHNWDYISFGVDVGSDGEESFSRFGWEYDVADDDTDLFVTSYIGNVADVVVPASQELTLNSGTATKFTTGTRPGAFSGETYMETLTFPNTAKADDPYWETNFPIIAGIDNNPLLETISLPYGTRILCQSNWADNGMSTSSNVIGYNNGIYNNPSLQNFVVPNGNKFGFYALDGILVNNGQWVNGGGLNAGVALIHYPEGRLGNQTLPTEITTIYANAFIHDTDSMTVSGTVYADRDLYLDASHVTKVYPYAFNDATALKSIDLRSCTSIGEGAFDNWTTEEKAALIIKGYANSYVATYCATNGIGFEAVACSENHSTTANYSVVYANNASDACLYNHVCNVCGEVIGTEYQHGTYTLTVELTEADCTNAGEGIFACDICGATETREIQALGHDYVAVVTAPTATEQGYTTYTCSRCGASYVADYTDPTGPAAPTATTVQFGKGIRLGATINLNIIVNGMANAPTPIPATATNVKATVWYLDENGEKAGIVESNVTLGAVTTISYDKLPAYALQTLVYGQVTYTDNGVDYISQEYSTSSAAYCTAQLAKTTLGSNLRRLMVDLLNYGSAAQVYFASDVDNLANKDIDAYQSEATASNPAMTDVAAISGTGVAVGASLSLKSRVEVKFQIPKAQLAANSLTLTAENSYLRVTRRDTGAYVDVALSGEEEIAYNFYYTGLSAFEFDVTVDAVLYIDGAAVSKTRTYSINSYLTKNVGSADANFASLCTMLSRYGAAAKVYVDAPNA